MFDIRGPIEKAWLLLFKDEIQTKVASMAIVLYRRVPKQRAVAVTDKRGEEA